MEATDGAGRLRALAEDYVRLAETMCSGQFADEGEWRALSSERTLIHDELLRLTGRTREDTDMYRYARALLADEPLPPPETSRRGAGHGQQ